MKQIIFHLAPSLAICFFSFLPVCFSQVTGWHNVTTLPEANAEISLNEMNGNLYVIGGENFQPNWHTVDNVWIYNIKADSLSSGTPMPAPRSLPSGTLVNGKIYAIGGHIKPRETATRIVEAYDIGKNSWDTCASIPTSRVWHAACELDGKIYILGGIPAYQGVDTLSPYTLVERYDPASDTWDTCASMPTGRWCLSACALNGKIYTIGGYSRKTSYSLVEVYDPETDQWSSKESMNLPRGEFGLTAMGGMLYAIGGSIWDGFHNIAEYSDFEVYDPESDTWTLNSDRLPNGRVGLAAVTVNNRIYVVGGVKLSGHTGIREVYMYDYPVATVDNRSYLDATDTMHALIHEDSRLFMVPDGVPAEPDSIIKYQVASWEAVLAQELELILQGIPTGTYLLYAMALDGRIAYDVPRFTMVENVPEFSIQIIDDYTKEKLSECQLYLNGKRFVKGSEDALDLTGWAYDTCFIQVTKSDYVAFDTTVVIASDTTFTISLQYAFQPELSNYSDSLLEKTDLIRMMMTQHGWIHLTPEGTPAAADSITKYSEESIYVTAGSTGVISLRDVPPGTYWIFGLSPAGRIATESYVVQVIDHFPECAIQVMDALSDEPLDSCLLVVEGQDTISGSQGAFDLTGLVYDTCNIEISREGYNQFDTTLVVLTDSSYEINLVPMIIEDVRESTTQEIMIYPNPANDLITVRTGEYGTYSLEIINLNGQVLKDSEFSGNSFQVDLSPFPGSIYLIRIISKDTVHTDCIVKH